MSTLQQIADQARIAGEAVKALAQAVAAFKAQEGGPALGRALNCKYTKDDRDRWREIAAKPDLAMHPKRHSARVIAMRLGLPKAAEDTIRREI